MFLPPSDGFFFLIIYLSLARLGLCGRVGFSVVAGSRGCSLVAVHGLLIAEAFLVVERGLSSTRA